MGVKNCPETPRQKMINMMYLVLTALLALNVSVQILDAFKIVDLSLIKTFESYTRKNISVMSDFDWQVEKGQKPETAKIYREKAIGVHNSTESIISLITEIKTELAIQIDSEKKKEGEEISNESHYVVTKDNDTLIIKRRDDLNVSSLIMVKRGKGEELRNKIIDYKSQLNELVQGDSILKHRLDSSFFENIDKILDVSNPIKKDKTTEAKTWVQQNFDRTPLIASITMLSKLQNDVRFAENLILNVIYSAIRGDSFFEAQVIPKSTYIISDIQNFEADIFLSAITNVPKAEAYINGSSTPIPLNGSKATYKSSPSKPGKYTYSGEIRYRNPEGFLASAPFKGEYEVAAPTATVSPSKMNVLYRGIDNPIEVSVPGVSSSQIRAVTDNGTIILKNDSLFIRPSDARKTTIDVFASIGKVESKMGSKVFRVKEVPSPILGWGSFKSGGQVPRGFQTSHKEISVYKPIDFDYDLQYQVTRFTVAVQAPGGNTERKTSDSNMLTDEQINLIGTTNKGDKVFFESISAKVKGTAIIDIALPPAYFTIN